MTRTAYSAEGKARREADLVRMREKWARDRKYVKRNGQRELLRLSDLARAIRAAQRLCRNEALIAHLEIAAAYFDQAENV